MQLPIQYRQTRHIKPIKIADNNRTGDICRTANALWRIVNPVTVSSEAPMEWKAELSG